MLGVNEMLPGLADMLQRALLHRPGAGTAADAYMSTVYMTAHLSTLTHSTALHCVGHHAFTAVFIYTAILWGKKYIYINI